MKKSYFFEITIVICCLAIFSFFHVVEFTKSSDQLHHVHDTYIDVGAYIWGSDIHGKQILFPENIEIVDLETGFGYTLVLDSTGNIRAWGENSDGQLGLGHEQYVTYPTKLDLNFKVRDISAGFRHSLIVSINGTVYASGLNISGQIGLGNTDNTSSFVSVNGPEGVVEATAGHRFSLARDKEGKIRYWGGSCNDIEEVKELKDLLADIGGKIKSNSFYFDEVKDPEESDDTDLCHFTKYLPDQVRRAVYLGKKKWTTAMTAGYGHVAIMGESGISTLGCNLYAQLGRNHQSKSDDLDLVNIITLDAGTRHTLFLSKSGKVWIAGKRTYIDENMSDQEFAPKLVTGLPRNIISIAAGHDYSLVLSNKGEVRGRGNNSSGAISSDLPYEYIDKPTFLFKNDFPVQHISAGGSHNIVY